MKKLILVNHLSPGDIVVLTAAVRDLHQSAPSQFATDVRTPCPDLWENNPYITALDEREEGVELIECHYPLIFQSNELPVHFLHGFSEFLSEKLGVDIRPTAFKGDIHLSGIEKFWMSQVEEAVGMDVPFWIIVAGGKYDFTIKWWDVARYQQVVDHFRDRILFVQVGEEGHHHPTLSGVLDLRGKTDLRQLVRLVYHSQGVLCPVTSLMHLAAAVETKEPPNGLRPCVVIAGGREPAHWEAYPGHQFLHRIGALACCARGGCWRSRTVPLGDGDAKDDADQTCQRVSNRLPKCMDLITHLDAIRAVESYFESGHIAYLTDEQRAKVNAGLFPP